MKNNKIVELEGDENHPFSKGKLCAKAYTFINRINDPKRILYPMRQKNRGSGNWERISWQGAIDSIALKIIELKEQYNSTLPIFFDTQSGNMGLLQRSLLKLFESLGPLTKMGNVLCASTGADAHYFTFGNVINSNPEDMVNFTYIIIWGGNPAWTCTHQLPIIDKARQRGAKLIVIDPVPSATSVNADLYINIRPGTDGALALGIAKYIFENKLEDRDYLKEFVFGWEDFKEYLEQNISYEWISETTGVAFEVLVELAEGYTRSKPGVIWQGLGAQRYINGGQNYRIINALAAITGNIGVTGSGVYYIDMTNIRKLNSLLVNKELNYMHRSLQLSQLANELESPIKMAFFTSSNPFAQYPASSKVLDFINKLDLVVTVDHFLSATAKYSDIFLPSAMFLEKNDVNASYWHQYYGYNQKAIDPPGQCKSEFEIAKLIAKDLNKKVLGTTDFPCELREEEFLAETIAPLMLELKDIRNFSEFKNGGYFSLETNEAVAWKTKAFTTPSRMIELFSTNAQKTGLPALPEYVSARDTERAYPYRVICNHSNLSINSQKFNIDVLKKNREHPIILVSESLAKRHRIASGEKIRVYNKNGEFVFIAEIEKSIAHDLLVFFHGNHTNGFTINQLTDGLETDMGQNIRSFKGIAFQDTFVNISKI